MNQGKYVFAQLMALVDPNDFRQCVNRYQGDFRVRNFSCWHHFLSLSFGQLTQRESLRDLVNCLEAHGKKLYHLGLTNGISRSTLSDANERRDWRIYADFAQILIQKARFLYQGAQIDGVELENAIYALDSTMIDLCLDVFWWAKFRKHKAAIKLHTLYDVKCGIPCFIHITDGLYHDVNVLDVLDFEAQAFYIMDKAYLSWDRMRKIHQANAFFVTRPRDNFTFVRIYSRPKKREKGILCDQIVRLKNFYVSKAYPDQFRRVKYYDKELDKKLVFVTNNLELEAHQIALLYKHRWQVELFFRWIKQHLRIKVFWGESANAVKTQIWVAVCTYVLVAILKKQLQSSLTMNEILQIISVSVIDKTPVNQLLMKAKHKSKPQDDSNQLIFFDL